MRSAIVGDRAPLGGRGGDDAIAVATDMRALVDDLAEQAETVADATIDRALRDELRAAIARWPVDTGRSRALLSVSGGSVTHARAWLARAAAPYSAFVTGRSGEAVSWVRFESPMRQAAERGLQAVADAIGGDR